MTSLPEHIAIIIEKQLKGLQSSAEMKVLEEWRAATAAHELFYQQVLKLWEESGALLQEPVFDTQQAWHKLDLALRHGKDETVPLTPIPQPRIRVMVRVLLAACLTGVLFLAGWMFFKKDTGLLLLQANGKANKQLTLPDGSMVVLREGAAISFPKTFSKKERAVTLTGDAYFDVQPDKDRPFRIQTLRANLEVIGTSFLVNSNKQYDRLVVTIGKVAFINRDETAERHIVSASEAAVLDKSGFNMQEVKDSNYLSWQTGILQFDNTPIDRVAAELADHYSCYIQPDSLLLQHPELYAITARFEKQPLAQVLEELKLLVNIRYRKQQDTIILFKP
ncbi:FecR family protein [Chitinophaga rupis]|uniref:FecR family protein n=1 Tax=Chitinophaga rupis TaxID=573321 RepID=A0A1H8B661_9BACT|nr:FecR domain-containing protein [Chitinophaga rupis]SEM77528.1 FecR family protein [Chitinophaga rupis]